MPISEATQQALAARYYPRLRETVFGRLEAQLAARLRSGAVVLDAGSGPGSWLLQAQRGRIGLLIGADVYRPDVVRLDAFVLASATQLPIATASLDMVVAYLMLEHLPDPQAAFHEFARVLKPGGCFCFKTPAVRTPLFLLAKLLPTALHRRLKGRIGIAEEEIFPTYYRANTVGELERLAQRAGLRRAWLQTVDQTYAYLSHTRLSYTLGLLYSRATEAASLAWLRNQIIGIYHRPEGSP
jgi:SAM-dependent methyltransferase